MKIPHIMITLVILSALCLTPVPIHAQRVYIDIDQPFAKKFTIAVPDFQPISVGAVGPAEVSDGLPKRLRDNLDMTGLFIPLDKRTFLETNARAGLGQGVDILFTEWLAIGSEFVVKGAYSTSGNTLTLELRLYDVVEGRMLLGKRYNGSVKDGREMINRFTNEILLLLTGEPGVFGTAIVFTAGTGKDKRVMMTEFGSDEVVQVSNTTPSMMPTMANNGTIAYVTRQGTTFQLISGGKPVHSGDMVIGPAYSPTGGLLAALSGPSDTNIYWFDGGKPKPVTNHFGINISPAPAPDGGRMAFVSDRAGGAQIYIESLGGGPARRLTTSGNQNTDPDWSPRGDRIAYVGNSTEIFTIDPGGGDVQQLTSGGRNQHPSWSPDGRLIVFSSSRQGFPQLFVMTANGERAMPLLPDFKSSQSTPFWCKVQPGAEGQSREGGTTVGN
jgi:TolB protein